VPLAGHGLRPLLLRPRASRPQLKRDPLGRAIKMRFLSQSECANWCGSNAITLSQSGVPEQPAHLGMPSIRFGPQESPYLLRLFCEQLASWFEDAEETLLWVPDNVWLRTLELYRRTRQGYGNQANLSEEPGHLFTGAEADHLASFILLALVATVDTHVLGSTGNRLFMSTNFWLEYGSHDIAGLETRRNQLREHGVSLFAARSA
jgi:hypothetical protein